MKGTAPAGADSFNNFAAVVRARAGGLFNPARAVVKQLILRRSSELNDRHRVPMLSSWFYGRGRPSAAPARSARLCVESLEDRAVPASLPPHPPAPDAAADLPGLTPANVNVLAAVGVSLNPDGSLTAGERVWGGRAPDAPLSVSLAFGPAGAVVLAVRADGTLVRYDALGARTLAAGVRDASVAYGPAGEVALVTLRDGTLLRFDALGARVLALGVRDASVAFGPAGESLLVTFDGGVLAQFDASGARVLSAGVRNASAAFGPSGESVVVVTDESGQLGRFDGSGASVVGVGTEHASVAFGPGGPVLLMVAENGTVTQTDASGTRSLGRLP